jgi:hypothetical protein
LLRTIAATGSSRSPLFRNWRRGADPRRQQKIRQARQQIGIKVD